MNTLTLEGNAEKLLEGLDAAFVDRVKAFVTSAMQADASTFEAVKNEYMQLASSAAEILKDRMDLAAQILEQIIKPAYLGMRDRLQEA